MNAIISVDKMIVRGNYFVVDCDMEMFNQAPDYVKIEAIKTVLRSSEDRCSIMKGRKKYQNIYTRKGVVCETWEKWNRYDKKTLLKLIDAVKDNPNFILLVALMNFFIDATENFFKQFPYLNVGKSSGKKRTKQVNKPIELQAKIKKLRKK